MSFSQPILTKPKKDDKVIHIKNFYIYSEFFMEKYFAEKFFWLILGLVLFLPVLVWANECSYEGQVRCYGENHRQICGNYDSDPYLEWSEPQSCVESIACGYGSCAENQRPSWYCSNGSCVYRCINDSQCGITPASCQCISGPCCDGCYYKPSTVGCNFEFQTEYGCPWGLGCSVDVGRKTRTKLQYCSGISSQCNGRWSDWLDFSDWVISDYCSSNEVCVAGNTQCQYNSNCVQPITSKQDFSKACDCPETPCSCPQDSKTGCLTISVLGKKEKEPIQWLKNLDMNSGEGIDFLVVVTNGGQKTINDVIVKAEIPSEITYEGDLKIDGASSGGDLKTDINIGSLSAGIVKTISFRGKVQSGEIKAGEKEVIGIVKAENLSDSDSVKIVFKTQGKFPAMGLLATIKFFTQKWYFWILAVLVFLFLFFVIFRRLFSTISA